MEAVIILTLVAQTELMYELANQTLAADKFCKETVT